MYFSRAVGLDVTFKGKFSLFFYVTRSDFQANFPCILIRREKRPLAFIKDARRKYLNELFLSSKLGNTYCENKMLRMLR